MNNLTDTQLKNLKPDPTKKITKVADGEGLYIQVEQKKNKISKLWRLAYRFNGKQKTYPIGRYPDIKLTEARNERHRLKNLIANGNDPMQQKQEAKREAKQLQEKQINTFEKIATQWHSEYHNSVTSEKHHSDIMARLNNHIMPVIGGMPIDEITPKQFVEIFEKLKEKNIQDTARRLKQYCNKIFNYAITYEYTHTNPLQPIDINIILGKKSTKNFPEIKDPKAVLASIDDYQGHYFTKKAMQLLPYVFLRNTNLRLLEWGEVDFKNKQLVIPAQKMKVKNEFILPLSNQALAILQEVHQNRTSDKFVFSSPNYKDRGLSDNTILGAFRRMGFSKEEIVGHSFRNLFSTTCYNNQKAHKMSEEVIESLLHHQEKNQVKRAYNRAKYTKPKKELIQWYADYIDDNYR